MEETPLFSCSREFLDNLLKGVLIAIIDLIKRYAQCFVSGYIL
jgi:hypothetical protein